MVERYPIWYIWKKLHLRFQACPHHELKYILHFMSILSTLFSCSSIAELFCHLNKPVMMCLRVNVQCANCFDLSCNKSDWHFIFIFAAHNRPLPHIVDPCPVLSIRRRYYFQKQSAYRPCVNRELLWFTSRFINREMLFFFIFRAQCGRGRVQSICFYSGQHSVVISVVPADVFAILAKISVQNLCIPRSKSFGLQIQRLIISSKNFINFLTLFYEEIGKIDKNR